MQVPQFSWTGVVRGIVDHGGMIMMQGRYCKYGAIPVSNTVPPSILPTTDRNAIISLVIRIFLNA